MDGDAVLVGTDALHRLGTAYPRITAGLSVALGAMAVMGFVCAQFDADKLRANGHPRWAAFVHWGAKIGGFALKIYRARREGEAAKEGAPL